MKKNLNKSVFSRFLVAELDGNLKGVLYKKRSRALCAGALSMQTKEVSFFFQCSYDNSFSQIFYSGSLFDWFFWSDTRLPGVHIESTKDHQKQKAVKRKF